MDERHDWHARVMRAGPDEYRAFARSHAFTVGRAASFAPADANPSAIELLLGALGADLLSGWYREAERDGLAVDAAELNLACHLHDPLAHLGAAGAEGSAGIGGVRGTLYVSAEADAGALAPAWRRARERSPLLRTLERACPVDIELKPAT
jgi:hypothetical protein